jgi:hypothetical protein
MSDGEFSPASSRSGSNYYPMSDHDYAASSAGGDVSYCGGDSNCDHEEDLSDCVSVHDGEPEGDYGSQALEVDGDEEHSHLETDEYEMQRCGNEFGGGSDQPCFADPAPANDLPYGSVHTGANYNAPLTLNFAFCSQQVAATRSPEVNKIKVCTSSSTSPCGSPVNSSANFKATPKPRERPSKTRSRGSQ